MCNIPNIIVENSFPLIKKDNHCNLFRVMLHSCLSVFSKITIFSYTLFAHKRNIYNYLQSPIYIKKARPLLANKLSFVPINKRRLNIMLCPKFLTFSFLFQMY